MTIPTRPTPIRRTVDSWQELDALLARRTVDFAADFDESEVAQSIGWTAQQRSKGRVAMLTEVRAAIREAVEAEAAEQAETAAQESIEARYKAAYGDEPLAPYQAEGR